ncbi:MAG: pyroglutamyl-peptidase I, partial [Lactobacillales bacterium]|nr:pyroglutamyl-peptidase I [Lactobacillales bacterium]
MKILVTAFDPFGGEKINPALEAVKLLEDEIAGAEIVKLEIPTVFHKSAEVMREKALE